MASKRRVVWTQGMLLMPHHFQQQARHFEHLVHTGSSAANPHAWGFSELQVDESQLSHGCVVITRASGLLPDGQPFTIPEPGRNSPSLKVWSATDEVIFLAARRAKDDEQTAFELPGKEEPLAAYSVVQEELRDSTNAKDDPETVEVGSLKLCLVREREMDSSSMAALGIVRVKLATESQLELDPEYLPPVLGMRTSLRLTDFVKGVASEVRQRAKALAENMGLLGGQLSEVADFMLLQVLNRYQPALSQLARDAHAHPWSVHQLLLQLVGDLATFLHRDKRPPEYPEYRHDDLQATFLPIQRDLVAYLTGIIVQRRSLQIPLVRQPNGALTATFEDKSLLKTAALILAVRAQIPSDQLRTNFPNQTRIGPIKRFDYLVNQHVLGISMQSRAVAPPQIPFHSGSHYFELDRRNAEAPSTNGDRERWARERALWDEVVEAGSLFVHTVSGRIPGLEIDFWAIRGN